MDIKADASAKEEFNLTTFSTSETSTGNVLVQVKNAVETLQYVLENTGSDIHLTQQTFQSGQVEALLEEGDGQDDKGSEIEVSLMEAPELISETTVQTTELLTNSDRELQINQSWFTGKQVKESLQCQGHKWRQGMWSKEEIALLIQNINDYVKEHNIPSPMEVIFQSKKDERKNFYRTIAKGLDRPLFAIYRRVQRMYDSKNYVGRYSKEDIQRLKELRGKHGKDWAKIGAAMGRSASSVKDKCRLLKEPCHQGKWKNDEEERLTLAVYEVTNTPHGQSITTGISWQQVAEKVGTRTEKQCRAKWLNYLNWKHTGGTDWNKADEKILMERIIACDVKEEQALPWDQIASDWRSVRSPQWLRSKWWSLKRGIPGHETLQLTDILESLKGMDRKQRVREHYLSETHTLARVEVPQLGNAKSTTLTLHLPTQQDIKSATFATATFPSQSGGEQMNLPTFNLISSSVAQDATHSIFVQSPNGQLQRISLAGLETVNSVNQIVVTTVPASSATHSVVCNKHDSAVHLETEASDELIITADIDQDSLEAEESRVCLEDSEHLVSSESSGMTHPDHEDHHHHHLMNQSDSTDPVEDQRISDESKLIGTDAVLAQQELEVTTSELQVDTEATNDAETALVIVRTVPPSEGLVQPGGSGVDGQHLENSVFSLSGSILPCSNDSSSLMGSPADLETSTKSKLQVA